MREYICTGALLALSLILTSAQDSGTVLWVGRHRGGRLVIACFGSDDNGTGDTRLVSDKSQILSQICPMPSLYLLCEH